MRLRTATLALGLLWAVPAHAQTRDPILVEAHEVLPGSLETLVELVNERDVPATGRVEIVTEAYGGLGGSTSVPVAEAPFALGPRARGHVVLSVTTQNHYSLAARAVLADGTPTPTEVSVNGGRGGSGGPNLFVDLTVSTGLVGALNDNQVPGTSGARETVSAAAPAMPSSGVPAIPTTLGGYANASVVHTTTKQLLALGGVELEALVDFVAHGGTLALSVDDPARLADPKLLAFLGGPVTASAGEAAAFGQAVLLQKQASGYDNGSGSAVPARVDALGITRLTSFRGGNLEPSPFGATAAYGMGRVMLLPFLAAPAADDPWAVGKLAELTVDASHLRQSHFSEVGTNQLGSGQNRLQRALDPNQRFRITLGIATAMLLVYAGVVAWALLRDQKNRRLFRAFVWLPGAAAALSAGIVLLGFASRGTHRGIRRVLVLEAGAGHQLVSVDEYRGYFTSGSEVLTLASHAPRSLLFAAELGAVHQRDGFSFLREKPRLPWQTTLTRELHFEQSAERIDLGETAGHLPWVQNETRAALDDVIVVATDGAVYYAPHLGAGETLQLDASQLAAPSTTTLTYGFDPSQYSSLAPDARVALGQRYEVLGALTSSHDAYLEGQTSLIARAAAVPFVHDGEAQEGGLPITTVDTFVHVTGQGGAR